MLNNTIAKIKPKSLDNFFKKLNFFKGIALEKAKHYISGLMQGFKRFNLETLQLASVDSGTTYRQLHYFIDKANWDENKLNEVRIDFLQNDVRTRTKKDGCISIDDTSVKKYGDKTDGVYCQYSGTIGGTDDCKVVVTSHYSDDSKDFPLDAESYYHGDVSKLDLACLMIDKAIERNLSFDWLNFDSWYCTKQVIDKAKKHKKYFVSYLKSNRVVIWKNQRFQVSDLAKVATAQFPNDEIIDLGACHIKSLGEYRLVIKDGKCFVTNNLKESKETIIEKYKLRWKIDDFYRQSKDNLGFDQFQVRKGLSIMRHWILVFLAYTFWIHCKMKGVFSKIYQGTLETLSDFTKVMQNLNLIRVAKNTTNVLLANFSLKSLN